jgi:predicted GIY-YIG superfamily endonuclease
MAAQTINWPGQSGEKYLYHIYNIGTQMDAVPANYIFARKTEAGRYVPIYIGQTSDISERFDNHHKMPCIRKNGATHIHTHESSTSEKERQAEETDLIRQWSPICND